ncbi:hypothetical protein HYV81_00020 [Candidatus Woesearchaeota archaeon]|nr:hypothetical protein [Candidatus Woesearchaeota archaeon]
MNKILFSFMIVILLFGVTACKKSDVNTKVITSFRTGIGDLEIKFLDNAPPAELYYSKDAQFPIGLQIQNKGAERAYGVIALNFGGHVTLADTINAQKDDRDANLFKIAGSEGSFLEGKRSQNPNGDLQVFTLTAAPSALNPQSEQFKSTVIATACYDYQTEFTPEVCIDTDVYNQKQLGKACKVQDVTSSGQGAPVVVERVEVQMLPKEKGVAPQFTITLKNSGNGEVIRREKYREVCSQRVADTSVIFNLAYVYAQLADKDLECYPKKEQVLPLEPAAGEDAIYGYARFKDKASTVVCRYNGVISKPEGSYVSKLRIVVYYGYTFSVSKDITIKVPLPKSRPESAPSGPQSGEVPCDLVAGCVQN